MPSLPDLALLEPDAPRLGRALHYDAPQQWQLRDCRLTLLPLHCRDAKRHLQRSLNYAAAAGCRALALAPASRRLLQQAPLFLADGRLLQLSALTRRLDLDCPGWRKDRASLNADDSFSCLAARLLAPEIAKIHLFGQDRGRREALSRLLYRESGLIATAAPQADADSLLILPPESSAPEHTNNAYLWQNWPDFAVTAQDTPIAGFLAEGLLLASDTEATRQKPLQLLHTLRRRSAYEQIRPV